MRTEDIPVSCLERDEERGAALLQTPAGLLTAHVQERYLEAAPTLSSDHPLHGLLGRDTRERSIAEHALELQGGRAARWNGLPLPGPSPELPRFIDPWFSAGDAPSFARGNIIGSWTWSGNEELRQILVAAHRRAAELLIDPTELHAERLYHASERIERFRRRLPRSPTGARTPPEVALLYAELEYLHLAHTTPEEGELREITHHLAPEWTGTASELLAAGRELLA